jgi:ribosome-associated toxin RatA of RatAB toxin-antitoxin module
MPKLDFSISLPASSDKLVALSTDYEKFPTYLPDQLKSVKIIEKNDNQIITEETLFFATVLKQQIIQQSIHRKVQPNVLETEIVSGPAKGTIAKIIFEKMDSGTKVTIEVNLKVSLKYKIFQPLIKKWYGMILRGILYKMNARALEN